MYKRQVDPFCLFSEHQKYVVGVGYVGIYMPPLGGGVIKHAAGISGKKIICVFIISDVEQMPIIQSGALELTVVDLEA